MTLFQNSVLRNVLGNVDDVAVQRAFERYRNDFIPKIDNTDKEIDQMVYELYGLTDEEIVVVEGG